MQLKVLICALPALIVASAVAQTSAPADWMAARPLTAVFVDATDTAGVFKVSAVITDAQSAKVLATPTLFAQALIPATFQIGAAAGVSLRFTVTIDAGGQIASYRSETRKEGQIQSGYAGLLHVEHGV